MNMKDCLLLILVAEVKISLKLYIIINYNICTKITAFKSRTC